jgi:hypothetical protein
MNDTSSIGGVHGHVPHLQNGMIKTAQRSRLHLTYPLSYRHGITRRYGKLAVYQMLSAVKLTW